MKIRKGKLCGREGRSSRLCLGVDSFKAVSLATFNRLQVFPGEKVPGVLLSSWNQAGEDAFAPCRLWPVHKV